MIELARLLQSDNFTNKADTMRLGEFVLFDVNSRSSERARLEE